MHKPLKSPFTSFPNAALIYVLIWKHLANTVGCRISGGYSCWPDWSCLDSRSVIVCISSSITVWNRERTAQLRQIIMFVPMGMCIFWSRRIGIATLASFQCRFASAVQVGANQLDLLGGIGINLNCWGEWASAWTAGTNRHKLELLGQIGTIGVVSVPFRPCVQGHHCSVWMGPGIDNALITHPLWAISFVR